MTNFCFIDAGVYYMKVLFLCALASWREPFLMSFVEHSRAKNLELLFSSKVLFHEIGDFRQRCQRSRSFQPIDSHLICKVNALEEEG